MRYLSELTVSLNSEPNAVIRLRDSTVVLVTLQMDARFFKVDGITKEEIDHLYNGALKMLNEAHFDRSTSPDLYNQKLDLQMQQPETREVIDDAYRE